MKVIAKIEYYGNNIDNEDIELIKNAIETIKLKLVKSQYDFDYYVVKE